jgi:hypothetical protein
MDDLTLVRELRADVPAVDEVGHARARAAIRAEFAAERGRQHRSRVPRWARFAAIAGVLGAALGFGLATWLTPTGSARRGVVGFGFLAAKGWTVVQSGTMGATGNARAVAANVPLRSFDQPELASLPPHGVVIVARFTTRGDLAQDAGFPVRRLPLRLGAADHLRAGVEGYNVDVRVYYGRPAPSAAETAAAQRQLSRLVVAAERVTLAARPTEAAPEASVTLFGSVDSGRRDETVDIQARDCGQRSFRNAAGAHTGVGGEWTTDFFPGINTTLRAVWRGNASPEITVRQRAAVRLRTLPASPRRFEVVIVAKVPFWRKRVLFQRLRGTWQTVKPVVLNESVARPGAAYVWSSAKFSTSLPRGTRVRVLLPLSEARPCYVSAASRLLRVG